MKVLRELMYEYGLIISLLIDLRKMREADDDFDECWLRVCKTMDRIDGKDMLKRL